MYVGVCVSVNIGALSRGTWEGDDCINCRGSLLTVMMISDWMFTSILRQKSDIWAFKSLWKHINQSCSLLWCVCTTTFVGRVRVTGENPAFRYSVNITDRSLSVSLPHWKENEHPSIVAISVNSLVQERTWNLYLTKEITFLCAFAAAAEKKHTSQFDLPTSNVPQIRTTNDCEDD